MMTGHYQCSTKAQRNRRKPISEQIKLPSPQVLIEPVKGVLPLQNLKSLDNWRAFLHQATPVIVTALVAVGIVTNSQAALWIPLFFAILDPILSVANTQDKIRRIIYGVAGLGQTGALAVGLATLGDPGGHVLPLVGAGLTVASTFWDASILLPPL